MMMAVVIAMQGNLYQARNNASKNDVKAALGLWNPSGTDPDQLLTKDNNNGQQ